MRVFNGFAGLAQRVALWMTVGRSRRALDALDDHMLADIGVSRADAMIEAERAPWDTAHTAGLPPVLAVSSGRARAWRTA